METLTDKRNRLKELSSKAKEEVKKGAAETVNEALIKMYENEGHKDFLTVEKWRLKGYEIKDNEKPFLLWGKPLNKIKHEESSGAPFFTLVNLFSNKQVKKI